MKLEQGKSYVADVDVGALLSLAPVSTSHSLAARFQGVGFTGVRAWRPGSRGSVFRVKGTWARASADVELPSQVRNVEEVSP